MQGATWSISYGDGSGAAGTVGMDVVNIGGATATRQAVELATAVSQSFSKDTNNDGLVGLAFSQLNTIKPTKQTTFFDSVMPQLAMPVFSVDLKNDSTGTYQFGAIDMSKAQGPLTTIPVNSSSGFWQVDSPTVTIGNQKIANQGGSPAIAGTYHLQIFAFFTEANQNNRHWYLSPPRRPTSRKRLLRKSPRRNQQRPSRRLYLPLQRSTSRFRCSNGSILHRHDSR